MTVCKNSQDLWNECRYAAAALYKKWRLISHEGVPFPPEEGNPQEESMEAVAEAIYGKQQEALEMVYRLVDKEVIAYSNDKMEAGSDEADYYHGALDALQRVYEFLRPMIAVEIDAVLEYEEQLAREAKELQKLSGH